MRRPAIAAAAVGALVLGVALFLFFRGTDDGLRRASGSATESTSDARAAYDLAATDESDRARVAGTQDVRSEDAATAVVRRATPRPTGILVAIGDVPAPGVPVELSRDGDVHAFVTDANGFVAVDLALLGDRWWSIDCGWRGHIPVQQYSFDPDDPYAQVELQPAQLLHVEVVRSDGRPFGGAPTGVWMMNEWSADAFEFGEWYGTHYGSRSRVGRQDMRCLELAGFGRTALSPGFTWVGPWTSGSSTAEFSGVFGEIDTNRVAWSGRAAPVAEGGGFTRIDLDVLAARDNGVVEVDVVEPYPGCLLDIEEFTLWLLPEGDDGAGWVRLIVLAGGWKFDDVASARLEFEVPPGTYRVRVDVDGAVDFDSDVLPPLVVMAGSTTTLELVLPPLGAIVVTGAPNSPWSECVALQRVGEDDESTWHWIEPGRPRSTPMAHGRYVAIAEGDNVRHSTSPDAWQRGLLVPRPMSVDELALHPWFSRSEGHEPWRLERSELDADGDGRDDLLPEDPLLARIAFDLEAGEIETLYFVPWPQPQPVEKARR